jgi:integrase
VPELAEALRDHREALLREQNPGLAAGWVFPSAAATPLSGGALSKLLERGLKAAGIEKRLTPHGLRRTLNSIALQVAPGEVVRKITGHTTVGHDGALLRAGHDRQAGPPRAGREAGRGRGCGEPGGNPRAAAEAAEKPE